MPFQCQVGTEEDLADRERNTHSEQRHYNMAASIGQDAVIQVTVKLEYWTKLTRVTKSGPRSPKNPRLVLPRSISRNTWLAWVDSIQDGSWYKHDATVP
ncbi:uncharacterized protein RAG0_10160 [Rhynchosporium agropyri]|uniref:Uncharacterized protein n=1 Tax=Rhynchosporium agropyri TaxID=914238 RepID=A0A1E1KYQ2_9HELO|nr:uncharacterized protein RAG0_10160 [Rhynchosporium agropyri]